MLRAISSLDAARFIRHDTNCDEENGQETVILRLVKYQTSHMFSKVMQLLLTLLISNLAHRLLLSRPYRYRESVFESHYIRFAFDCIRHGSPYLFQPTPIDQCGYRLLSRKTDKMDIHGQELLSGGQTDGYYGYRLLSALRLISMAS